MHDSNPRIASVTVTYNPDPTRLAEQLRALRGQVGDVIVVDNASECAIAALLVPEPGAELPRLIALPDNLGIASAFNVGVREARRAGADFVLLLDHDSIPAPGMVEALLAGYGRQAAGGARIAAVGPRVDDARDHQEYPFIRVGWTHNRHLRCGNATRAEVACDFLISSGTLLAMEHFDSVGEFDETLFIDSVDLEWCCRARSRGLALYGVCGAQLDHWLGDERRKVLGSMTLVVHSPHRLYYMTRNRFLLYRRAYMPLKWKLKDFLRGLAKLAATLLLVSPRRAYARMTVQAVRDAFGGRVGKLPP